MKYYIGYFSRKKAKIVDQLMGDKVLLYLFNLRVYMDDVILFSLERPRIIFYNIIIKLFSPKRFNRELIAHLSLNAREKKVASAQRNSSY